MDDKNRPGNMADKANLSRCYQIGQHGFEAPSISPGLYIVSTPIGNLRDITLRALDVLAGADFIACEDTRVSAKLLNHYGIRKKTVAYHEHNARLVEPKLLAELKSGLSVALVSDAGTPTISDPGLSIVQSARMEGVSVYAIPGPSSPIAALATSGLAASSYVFTGFLPTKTKARQMELARLSGIEMPIVLFESPKRLTKTLADIRYVFGSDHGVTIARELTKMHEEVISGPIDDMIEHFSTNEPRGELVVLIEAGSKEGDGIEPLALLEELMATMSVSRAVAEAHAVSGLPKRDLYKLALSLKDQD